MPTPVTATSRAIAADEDYITPVQGAGPYPMGYSRTTSLSVVLPPRWTAGVSWRSDAARKVASKSPDDAHEGDAAAGGFQGGALSTR